MAAAPVPESDVGWYLYGVATSGAVAPDAQAVDAGHPVVALAEGGVTAIVSRVSLAEFDEAALPQRLADAAWLERTIRSHEQVLEGVLAAGPVVPCRFCTVYRDEHELRRFLAEHGDALRAALARLEGRVELGVKAFAVAANRGSGGAEQAESGRAYLEARRREQQAREDLARARGELARGVHERLLAAAEDGVLLDLQRPEVSGREAEMVFNGSYLVSDRGAFAAALEAAARGRDDVELELTGPWPPYNFVPEELGRA